VASHILKRTSAVAQGGGEGRKMETLVQRQGKETTYSVNNNNSNNNNNNNNN